MSGSVLGIHVSREDVALVFVLELVAAMARSFSIVYLRCEAALYRLCLLAFLICFSWHWVIESEHQ